MLLLYRCNCGGSENLIRRALERNKYKNWLADPIIVGKEAAIRHIESSSLPQDDIEIRSLKRFLKGTSSFAIVLGVKGKIIRWANLSDHQMTSKLDADVIIQKLA